MRKNTKVKGISLIVLVITIIVMIIIAGAIIISISNGNVVKKARQGKFMTNVQGYNIELQSYISNKQLDDPSFNQASVSAAGAEEEIGIKNPSNKTIGNYFSLNPYTN